jgi:urease accessory protein
MPETLPRATTLLPAGTWSGAAETVTLDFDDRFRRRRRYETASGLAFLLDLAEATVLRAGDALRLEDGRLVEIHAAPEPLVEVTPGPAMPLARIAWHLGNRHLPAEIGEARILIRRDHVIEQMLRGLGAGLRAVEAPFNPEGGAYGEHNRQPGHHHHHHDDHGHDHGDGHHHHHP